MKKMLAMGLLLMSVNAFSQDPYLFIGTYTNRGSAGVYVYRFNTSTAQFTVVDSVATKNPSYLAIAADGKHFYSTNESGENSMVSAFSFDPAMGKMRLLNSQPSMGADPAYVSVDRQNKWLFAANYSGGNLAAFPINGDGSIAPAAQVIQHEGHMGPVTDRQEKPHIHSVIFTPDEKFLTVADLGQDREYVYKFDASLATPLSGAADSITTIKPGTGPRHIVFHPTKPFAYLIGELSGTVDQLSFNAATGKLTPVSQYMSYAKGIKPEPASADIHISPNGKFLYASNRGNQNSIAAYVIKEDGSLALPSIVSTKGIHPRNFVIDPTGKFLLAANGDSDNIVVFTIDPMSGRLTATGQELKISNPVCLKFLIP